MDRRRISVTIRVKSDGEVTQGLILQTCHNSLYMGALLGYNKETIIEGIEGWKETKRRHVGGYAIRGSMM